MRPAPSLFMRIALVLVILSGFAITLARALPADAPFEIQAQLQVQHDSTRTPPETIASPSTSSVVTGRIGHPGNWRARVRGAWTAFSERRADAERSMHSGRRGRYLRRGRAHP